MLNERRHKEEHTFPKHRLYIYSRKRRAKTSVSLER